MFSNLFLTFFQGAGRESWQGMGAEKSGRTTRQEQEYPGWVWKDDRTDQSHFSYGQFLYVTKCIRS